MSGDVELLSPCICWQDDNGIAFWFNECLRRAKIHEVIVEGFPGCLGQPDLKALLLAVRKKRGGIRNGPSEKPSMHEIQGWPRLCGP
jgi:hypothetical protein